MFELDARVRDLLVDVARLISYVSIDSSESRMSAILAVMFARLISYLTFVTFFAALFLVTMFPRSLQP